MEEGDLLDWTFIFFTTVKPRDPVCLLPLLILLPVGQQPVTAGPVSLARWHLGFP